MTSATPTSPGRMTVPSRWCCKCNRTTKCVRVPAPRAVSPAPAVYGAPRKISEWGQNRGQNYCWMTTPPSSTALASSRVRPSRSSRVSPVQSVTSDAAVPPSVPSTSTTSRPSAHPPDLSSSAPPQGVVVRNQQPCGPSRCVRQRPLIRASHLASRSPVPSPCGLLKCTGPPFSTK